jgi:hypothetical protein
MESYQKAAAVAAFAIASATGCDGEVETTEFQAPGTDAGMDTPDAANEPDASNEADADVNENLALTRAQFAQSMVGEILGITSTQADCVSSYKDVPSNSALCKAVELLDKRGAMTGYKDANGQLTGFWGPNDNITRAQVAKSVTRAIGFAVYPADCLNNYPDVSQDDWFSNYMGSLCDHGLNIAKQDGFVHPNDNETTQEWDVLRKQLGTFLSGNGTRADIVEATDSMLFGNSSYGNLNCTSGFSDIPENTYLCVVINNLKNIGLIDGYPDGKFRPNDGFNFAEMSNIFVTACGLQDNGQQCTQSSQETWYYSYANILCQKGVISPDADMAKNPSVGFTYETAWKVAGAKQ